VELGLLAERHEELRRAAAAADGEAEAARAERGRLESAAAAAEGRQAELANEVANLNAALDLLAEQHEAIKGESAAQTARREAEESAAQAAAARLAAVQQSSDARHKLLTERLEAALRELQVKA